MVLLHGPSDAAQHQERLVLVRLVDLDDLEAAGQRRVLLDVLLVLGPGGGGDGAQRAARQRRLEQVGGVAGAGRAAGADQRVRLVDEQDDRLGRRLHLVDHLAQPLLELALHARAGLQQADVERAAARTSLQRRRHVAARDALREALDHRGLADAGLAGEDRVVLAAAHQDVDDLADLLVAADDRVDLARLRLRGQVLREAVERGRALRPGARPRAPGVPAAAQARAVHRAQILLVRAGPDRAVLVGERVDIDLGEFLRDGRSARGAARATCSAPTSTWPVRICVSPKNSVA